MNPDELYRQLDISESRQLPNEGIGEITGETFHRSLSFKPLFEFFIIKPHLLLQYMNSYHLLC